MSHFTVLVIGDNPESQLAPYNENISLDPYIKGPVSEEEKQRFLDHYLEEKKISPEQSFDEAYGLYGDDWNGNRYKKISEYSHWPDNCSYCGQKLFNTDRTCPSCGGKIKKTEQKDVWVEYSTYNLESKWDWYTLGGRWTGFFKLKESPKGGIRGFVGEPGLMTEPAKAGWADAALKKDIDFDGMRDAEVERQLSMYKHFHKILAGRYLPQWKDVLEKYPNDIDRAREEFNGLQVVKDLKKEDFLIWDDGSYYMKGEEDFIASVRRNAICTFAVVKNGKWYERGDMGWWGLVANEKETSVWEKEFYDLLDGLPEDTLLSVYDCHI